MKINRKMCPIDNYKNSSTLIDKQAILMLSKQLQCNCDKHDKETIGRDVRILHLKYFVKKQN